MYGAVRSVSSRASCHKLIDPIGFSFEHYDGIGRFRDSDQGQPVDATGALTAIEAPVEVDGAMELAAALAEAPETQACAPRQLFRYAYGRAPTEADACTEATLADRFAQSGGDLRELLIAITQTDAFLFKTAGD